MIRLLRVLALLAIIAGLVVGGRVLRGPETPPRGVIPVKPRATTVPDSAAPRLPDSVLALAVSRAPFRAERKPAPMDYDATRSGPAAAGLSAPPRPPHPVLVLTGIVWGAEPRAVIEGLPETDGPRVVRRGDTVGKLKVTSIRPDRVQVAGMDTVWTLRLRTTWQ